MGFAELVAPRNKSAARFRCLAAWTVAYCAVVFAVYRIQVDGDYTPFYVASPFVYASVWMIVINAV